MRLLPFFIAAATLCACASPSVPTHSSAPSARAEWKEIAVSACAVGSIGVNPNCPPAPTREFRAAWVATVANIDWPSAPGLSVAQLRAEMNVIVERAAALKLNALIVQVRPAGDAIYPSALEPWSEYLTGAQGVAPNDPNYDALAEWIEHARARGIQIHAWFNPYRARHSSAKSAPSSSHASARFPASVVQYGDMQWMNPASVDVREHSLRVIEDVVRRYDIAGVHIDDYFYPYPITDTDARGQKVERDFPDDAQWNAALSRGTTLSRAAWRREHVDTFVSEMFTRVRALKPNLLIGISPFGIGKPALRPNGISGFSQYDKLYADVEKWMDAGWLDYIAPQLYWPINQTAQSFPILLDYWHTQNLRALHVWPGLFTSRMMPSNATATSVPWPRGEIDAQIELIRKHAKANLIGVNAGFIHFSMKALMMQEWDFLSRDASLSYALPPISPWLPAPTTPLANIAVSFARKNIGTEISIRATPHDPNCMAMATLRVRGQWTGQQIALRCTGDAIMLDERIDAADAIAIHAESARGDVLISRVWLRE